MHGGNLGYGGSSGDGVSRQVVTVKALREDQLQFSGGHLPWNVLGLAQPPKLWGASKVETSATLQWKLHICSAKSQVTDWAVGDRNSLQGVLGQLDPVQLRTGIFSLELTVSPGALIPVSWTSSGSKGSSVELLHFARPFSVCATHRSPDVHVLCRALCPGAYEAVQSTSTATVVTAGTAAAYADAWKGLVELEAVASAVDEGLGRHLTDVWVDWEESDEGLLGRFDVKAALLFAHKMKFRSAMLVGEWASSWLCVRRHLKGPGGRPWHGHGAVIKASFDEKDLLFADEDETWQEIAIFGDTGDVGESGSVVSYPEQGFYLLELIPKALSESCMALALGEVAQCPLVQSLVLDGRQRGAPLSVCPSRNGLALAETLQASFEALMEQLNASQRSAVDFALKHSLAQVQGPPGTGKTMTTAVLATCFAAENMSSGENRAVLLCTPTNRAADCAAAFVAKICNRHAERRLEQTAERRLEDGPDGAPCCAVCLREKPDVITLCNHVFHKRCLAQALEVGSRCPICRRHVKHIETGLRILRIYGADIEKQEFPVPKRNEHAGLENRKVVEVPQELRRFSLHWRCHAAAEGERASPEALKTRKAYREMIQHGTKGPRADQLRRSYQQALAEARRVELREADLVFSTCVSCRRMAIAQALSEEGAPAFWQVILDEAGQATEPEALCALTFARSCRQICLFGDQQQLRPILKNQLAEAKGMAVSLFERLALTHEPQFLAIQYRMTPSISSFPSHQFYQGRLLDDVSTERTPTLLLHPMEERSLAMMAWDLGSDGERVSYTRTVESSAGSRVNDWEAQRVVELALMLTSRAGPQAVGILCWYRAQVARVLELLREQGQSSIHVGSVATAQGSEWDYVLLSTVRRAGASGRLGILADAHILNVALTRARRGLVVLGHEASLSSDLNWKAFFNHCRTKDVLIQGMPRVTSDEEILKESWCRALVPGLEVQVHGLQSQPDLNGKTGTIVALENEKGRWEVELPALNGSEEPRRLALKPGNLRLVKVVPMGDPKGNPKGPSFGGLNVLVAKDGPKETGVEFSTTLCFQALQLEPNPPRHGIEVTVVDRNSPCHGLRGTVQSRGQNISSGVSVEFCKRFHLQQGPVQVRPGKKGLEVAAQNSVEHLLRRGLVVMLHGLKSKPELNAEWARVVCEEAKEDGRWEVELLESLSQVQQEARRLALKPENLAPEV